VIVGLEGKIERREATYLHLNVNGVIYEVFISINCSNQIDGDEVKLLITEIIRDDSNTLYGFLDRGEKQIFDTLIKINGIGAKVAMAVCSTYTPQKFSTIIATKDLALLKKVAGIGAKSATRIMVELSGFIIDIDDNSSKDRRDAVLALESLGFSDKQIEKALSGLEGDTQTLIKGALRKLQKL
jgi:Holliday junction DNA helicase RuvA